MHRRTLLLTSLAYVSNGSRTMPTSSYGKNTKPSDLTDEVAASQSWLVATEASREPAKGRLDSANVFATFLSALTPTVAFSLQSAYSQGYRARVSRADFGRMDARRERALSRRDLASVAAASVFLQPFAAYAFKNPFQDVLDYRERLFDEYVEDKERREFIKSGKMGVAGGATYQKQVSIPVEGLFGTPLYLLMRVREATTQQERLISKGTFKDVQRGNIKMAVRMMTAGYDLQGALDALARDFPDEKKKKVKVIKREIIESLTILQAYFGDTEKLTVDELVGEKKSFVIAAFVSCRDKIDNFLDLLPPGQVRRVQDFIDQENAENAKAMEEAGIEMSNPPSGSRVDDFFQ